MTIELEEEVREVKKPRRTRKTKAKAPEGKGIELLPEIREEATTYLANHPNVAPRWFWSKLREIAASAQREAIVGKLDAIARGDS